MQQLWRFLLAVPFCFFATAPATAAAAPEKSFAMTPPFRKNNIDYFDIETLNYYLDAPDPGVHDYDIVVFFYASWDRNSQKFSPKYGDIAHVLKAGTKDSHLLLGLFDCEKTVEHSKVCAKAGVKYYPSIFFVSLSGQSFAKIGYKGPKHLSQFEGNWQYGEAVFDWIKTMKGISHWHRAGWGKKLRQLFFKADKTQELPLGIPFRRSSSSTGTGVNNTDVSLAKYTKLEQERKDIKDLAVRGALMLESTLQPLSSAETVRNPSLLMRDNGKNYTDLYKQLYVSKAWDSDRAPYQVLTACVQDVGLDYCARVTTSVTEDYITHFESLPIDEQQKQQNDVRSIQKGLDKFVSAAEPFCVVLEQCILSSSPAPECRPQTCPFQDKTACRYLTSCLYESIQNDYAKAMGLLEKATEKPNEKKKKKGFFGMG
jgi:hypothetical protein